MGEEAGIAAKLAQDIATNVLSGQAANLTDPIFASLGIAQGSDTAAKYFQQVMGELMKIEGDLTKIAAKMQVISSGISEIDNAFTAISSQITDGVLQNQLAQYTESANIINSNYAAYAAALTAMATGDPGSIQEGTNQLFQIFQITNSDAVAAAMQNIHDLLVGSGQLHGIVSYQPSEVSKAYDEMASDPTQTTVTTHGWSLPYTDGSLIYNALPVVLASAFDKAIIPALKAALAVQLKGLNFLCAAWTGTINEPRLTSVTTGISDVIEAMRLLWQSFDFDTIVSSVLRTHCAALTPAQISQPWWRLARSGDFVSDNPFDETWVFWTLTSINSYYIRVPAVALAKAPWLYGTVPAMVITDTPMFTGMTGEEHVQPFYFDWGGWSGGDLHDGTMNIPRPSSTDVAPPLNFISFLASLPGTHINSVLCTGQFLSPWDHLVSESGKFHCVLQPDANLCTYAVIGSPNSGPLVWQSASRNPGGPYYLIMQADGNLCIYAGEGPPNAGGFLWQSGAASSIGDYFAVVDDAGKLSVYAGTPNAKGDCLWSSA